MNPKKWSTVEEIQRELENDPTYLTMIAEKEKKSEEAYARYQESARGVLAELAAAGFVVNSVGELVHQFARDHVPYKEAIPILIKWLPIVTYDRLKEDIIRTLSVPWAKTMATIVMVQEYVKAPGSTDSPPSSLRWAIGNALEVLADDDIFDDLVRIATDRRYGTDRQMVVRALGKIKNPAAVSVLIGLLNDEEVLVPAAAALGKLKVREALPYLELFMQHPKGYVRKEVKKAIDRIRRNT